MTRLEFLAVLLAPQILAGQSFQHAEDLPLHTGVPVVDLWNKLAEEARLWVELRNDTPPDSYSWAAKRQWAKVRKAFHDVDIAVQHE